MHVKIKTGSNLTKILESTVTIEQAFTELVKNSLQNNASFCAIDLSEEKAVITDDGDGFAPIKDQSGMNGFEKYFVFGNSYENNNSQMKLGHMGIGGKIANDKLSLENNPHWTIESKTIKNECNILEYKPPQGVEFLGDYSPEMKEVNDSSISTNKGSKISILALRQHIQDHGWNLDSIKKELASFFGELINSMRDENKKFDILLNGESLKFSYKLIGSNIPIIKKEFSYNMKGEEKTSQISFRLSLIRDADLFKESGLQQINLISQVKIGPFNLSKKDLFQNTIDRIFKKSNVPKVANSKIYEIFSRLIGFINCEDLTLVLDETGMPAKDLSHHSLRDDHPITIPFYQAVYEVIIEWIINYININDEDKMSLMNALAQEISSMLLDSFINDEDIFSLFIDAEGEESDKVATNKDFRDSVRETIQGMDFMMEEKKEKKEKAEEKEKPKQKVKKYIPYTILDFNEEDKLKMSKLQSGDNFRALINSANPKYKALETEPTPFLISLHIAECLFREIVLYKDSNGTQADIDEKISEFYENKFVKIKESMDQKIINR